MLAYAIILAIILGIAAGLEKVHRDYIVPANTLVSPTNAVPLVEPLPAPSEEMPAERCPGLQLRSNPDHVSDNGTEYYLVSSTTSNLDSEGQETVRSENVIEGVMLYPGKPCDPVMYGAGHAYDVVFETRTRKFACRYRTGTESGCELYVADSRGEHLIDLGIALDVSWTRAILPSRDGSHLLMIRDHDAIVLDTDTLKQGVIQVDPEKYSLGWYTWFPALVPRGRWLDDETIQLEVFKNETMESNEGEPDPVPDQIKTYKISELL